MRGIVLVCGTNVPQLPGVDAHRVVRVPHRPGKSDVDVMLAKAGTGAAGDGSDPGADVIVAGEDADLAAVALRLLRRDRLGSTSVGYLPVRRSSAFAELWQLPVEPTAALQLAGGGKVDPVPLIRDDVGGVLLGLGSIHRVNGIAYCDDEVVLRGKAHRIDVQPDTAGGAGLTVRVQHGRLRKQIVSHRGRAFSLGCDLASPVLDGVGRERPTERWTWYRHTEDLRLVRA